MPDPSGLSSHFSTFAAYNRWANRRLYGACAGLDASEHHRERPAFFGSIHATLNHILVGDRIWLGRITGAPSGIHKLDQVLYEDLAGLRAARQAEDRRIIELIAGFGEASYREDLSYESIGGERSTMPLSQVLAHVFNHQTHHRGQVHDQLAQTSVTPPPLDLIYFLRARGAAA